MEPVVKEKKDTSSSEAPVQTSLIKQIRVVVIGDAKVGKSSLIYTAMSLKMDKDGSYTKVFDAQEKTVTYEGQPYQLIILDTNAQERLRYSAYLGADLVIVLYSVTDLDSFNNVEKKWLKELKEKIPIKPFMVVGNKRDLRDGPQKFDKMLSTIDRFDGMGMNRQMGGSAFFEVSAKSRECVDDLLNEIPLVYEREWARMLETPQKLKSETPFLDMAMSPFNLLQRCLPVAQACYNNLKECATNPHSFADYKRSVVEYAPSFKSYITVVSLPKSGSKKKKDKPESKPANAESLTLIPNTTESLQADEIFEAGTKELESLTLVPSTPESPKAESKAGSPKSVVKESESSMTPKKDKEKDNEDEQTKEACCVQ